MSLADKIVIYAKTLPESKQIEALNFIKYLSIKTEAQNNMEWSELSLSAAMRGMENEESPYSLSDLKESFS